MPVPDSRLTPQQQRDRDVRREALAKALIAAREAAGLNQSELARESGISRSAIIRLERGEASISSDRLWDLARVLDTKPSALLAAAEADDSASRTLE
ncbi:MULTISPECIES: helix-turn-helix domain-containing protein [Mycobacteriales]|uniref:Helix-turn-helix transcriptional regulator n=1 Tax=Tsukamurella paurometabola TaxID=2061 RepID=A0ABS5NFJ7_TSUPA|nr:MULTISPECIES: helix-turn-helix transcriptional regulator [Mycobacteriales]MBS4103070.1 helix-turn-helix transcriptional regulator [Tsukamurella paurometabola]MCZ0911066.1 helix-turn-helix transcriptional regulator [Gordonia amicalis]